MVAVVLVEMPSTNVVQVVPLVDVWMAWSVTGCPPSSGAVHEMVSEFAVLDVTAMLVGAAGTVAGMMLAGVVDQLLVPSAVVCATRNW
jgi:hypothetical protein